MSTETQEEIYHWTINGLIKKIEQRDDLIISLRKEIAYLKQQMEAGDKDGRNH